HRSAPAREPRRARRARATAAHDPGRAPGARRAQTLHGRGARHACRTPKPCRARQGCRSRHACRTPKACRARTGCRRRPSRRAPAPYPVRSYRSAEASCSYCKVSRMPRIVDHASRRAEIVHALWAVIHEKGLDSVSFRAVAEAAGVSIGRIQHYFTSKEELIREGCAQLVAAAETQYAEVPEDAGPRRTLWHLVASPIPSTQPRRIGAAVW